MIGVSKGSVNNYFGGRIPGALILCKLAKVFGVSMEYLLTGKDINQDNILNKESKDEECKINHILGEISDEEIHFIQLLREIDNKEKIKIEGMLELKIAESNTNKKGALSTYHHTEKTIENKNEDENAATVQKLA